MGRKNILTQHFLLENPLFMNPIFLRNNLMTKNVRRRYYVFAKPLLADLLASCRAMPYPLWV